jgi:hypothetical protein
MPEKIRLRPPLLVMLLVAGFFLVAALVIGPHPVETGTGQPDSYGQAMFWLACAMAGLGAAGAVSHFWPARFLEFQPQQMIVPVAPFGWRRQGVRYADITALRQVVLRRQSLLYVETAQGRVAIAAQTLPRGVTLDDLAAKLRARCPGLPEAPPTGLP